MRHEHETATSFNQLQEITQAIMLKKGAPKIATHQESERTQKTGLKPKDSVKAKKGRLNPTKKAFSERQITAFRDNPQARANLSRKTKASHNANAFKAEQANNSNLRAKPSDEALNPGLATHQEKGSNDEA
ncbi:hypothetical protein KVL02_00970 [Helicobacter pylori]|uniref:hypothetical protein n=1 Tax=Helicobacter pylori TaxID=210 RepID=UPI000E246BCB|nr:hypothetical protein [Helicobacter pylori]RDY78652.1 hypothetical protein DDP36_01405 [Helicobacter pylori]RDY82118.1 hypothetical protein DDP45_01395 [Helicobacter pylori]RDY82259.1 hypothetical protein DDP35_01175 [Helicobacter pylori]WQX56600.1 hypothetical protein KVL02_00970 [Helicobacter pylori]